MIVTFLKDVGRGPRGTAIDLPVAEAGAFVASYDACYGKCTLEELDVLESEIGGMHAANVAGEAAGKIAKPPDVDRYALFSADRRFRYVLRRTFLPAVGAAHRLCVWLNPSDADETKDDASVRVGMGFARRWGDSGIIIVNVGDLVETYSKNLPALHADRLGPDHWEHVEAALSGRHGAVHSDVLCGWGDEGAGELAEETVRRLRAAGLRPCALALTKSGNPGHPLRKKAELVPVPFHTPAELRETWALAVKNARARKA